MVECIQFVSYRFRGQVATFPSHIIQNNNESSQGINKVGHGDSINISSCYMIYIHGSGIYRGRIYLHISWILNSWSEVGLRNVYLSIYLSSAFKTW